jgi:hypothetical protein
MHPLESLGGKVNQLIKRHASLEADNNRLRAIIEGQNKVIQNLHRKVAELDNGMVSVHLEKAGMDTEQKEDMKRQLDTLINEIDKIVADLNE